MDRLAARGVRAASRQPVFPTLTFPDHYSIATGLYPANHGLVANDFPDNKSGDWNEYKRRKTVQQGRWYGGEPTWVAAEKNGMVSAAFFFVGTEADIGRIEPTHWNQFDNKLSGRAAIANRQKTRRGQQPGYLPVDVGDSGDLPDDADRRNPDLLTRLLAPRPDLVKTWNRG